MIKMSIRVYNSTIKNFETKKTKVLPIKIIEKFNDKPKEFNTKDEFLEYLSEHIEQLQPITTCILNKMFSINGYRITRILNKEAKTKEISLKATRAPPPNNNDIDTKIETLNKNMKTLNDKLNHFIDTFTKNNNELTYQSSNLLN
jgi:tRNA A37 N6-isopentenylltransferase MiaA